MASNKAATSGRKGVHFTTDVHDDNFNTTKVGLTPSAHRLAPQYRVPEERSAQAQCVAPPSSITRPNYEDILRRVSIVIHQHIEKCEIRQALVTEETKESGMFHISQLEKFAEQNFMTPDYVYHFVRTPVSRMGFLYGIHKITPVAPMPSLQDIHTFLSDLFVKALLSAECSIVCLIYVERLMETAYVPLVSKTWRPVLLCGLLLASKVWQDLSSWNSEFAQIYPKFTLQAINKLEVTYCKELKWNLYISSSAYAKYYFALRSLTEKTDFRRNYTVMMVNAPGADQIAERSGEMRQQRCREFILCSSLLESVPYAEYPELMLRMRLKIGDIVIRSIEGMGFEAKVLTVNQNERELVLEYLDDGNIEKGVSFDDIQEIIEAKGSTTSTSRPHSKVDTLAKPLLGLVEDDYEARRNHQPKVFIHENVDGEESKSAIILNGAENKLAAGGGLRALRYLKK